MKKEEHFNSGENNGMWKGDKVGYSGVHCYVRKRKKKPEFCEMCKEGKAIDLANISGDYKRNLDDWEYLCRKCHMDKDGRNDKLRESGRSRKLPEKECLNCKKIFHSEYKKVKYCCRECYKKGIIGISRCFYGNQYINKLDKND